VSATLSPQARLDAKLHTDANGCRTYTGAVHHAGYGRFYLNGTQIAAHRAAAILAGLPVTDADTVEHTCGNALCCNPEHLTVTAGARRTNPERVIFPEPRFAPGPARRSHSWGRTIAMLHANLGHWAAVATTTQPTCPLPAQRLAREGIEFASRSNGDGTYTAWMRAGVARPARGVSGRHTVVAAARVARRCRRRLHRRL
jgi:hypothetical protein